MHTQALWTTSDSVEGWKRINKSFLSVFGGGKKSHNVREKAEVKGLFENHELRSDEHESFHYCTVALRTKGEVSADKLADLKAADCSLDLGMICYESGSYTGLSDVPTELNEDHSIVRMSEPDEGVFVMCATDDKLEFPATAYASVDGQHKVFPIASQFVS